MSFSDKAKLTALAIVHVFETSKPFGDYGAVAVLNDGAGVSYGINQFTHKSGSLYTVVNTYLGEGGSVGAAAMREVMPYLKAKSHIPLVSEHRAFKNALRAAAKTEIMQAAQREIAENFYLLPAIDACEGSEFVMPLSLAVVYDSINHGSYEKIRDRVKVARLDNALFERQWITQYVKNRDAWLESVQRLRPTAYRTDFFLAQIARGNWNLDLPLHVHGTVITDDMLVVPDAESDDSGAEVPAVEPVNNDAPVDPPAVEKAPADVPQDQAPAAEASGFSPEKFKAYVPQIDTAKSWYKRVSGVLGLSTVTAMFAGLPKEVVIGLFALLGILVIGGVVMFIKYHDKVFEYIGKMNTLRASSDTHDPEISNNPPGA